MDSIIFDVDGTLWNTTECVAFAWNRAIKENSNLRVTVTPEKLQSLFGKTMDEIGDALFEGLAENERRDLQRKCEQLEGRYLREHPPMSYPFVTETIHLLAKKYPLYIVSNCQKGYIELVMDAIGIRSCISDFLCFGDTGLKKAETLRLLVKRNHLNKPIYVGDTVMDAQACKEADIPFVYASYGFGKVTEYWKKVDSFRELLQIK